MKLIDRVVKDVGDIAACKQIRPFDVKYLGYKFSRKRIYIRSTNYTICELVDEDTSKPVSFCLLLDKKTSMGIILPFSYSGYFSLAVEERNQIRLNLINKNT